MTIKEIDNYISSFIEDLKKVNLSENAFHFRFEGKVVWKEDGMIYRLSNPADAKIRIGIQQYFEKKGFPIFLKENLIFSNEWCSLTSQAIIEEIKEIPSYNGKNYPILTYDESNSSFSRYLSKYFYEKYGDEKYEELRKLFHELQIQWIHQQNAGMNSNGEIRIFDYIANVAVNTTHVFCHKTGNLISLKEIGFN